jgi:hypothetical protein
MEGNKIFAPHEQEARRTSNLHRTTFALHKADVRCRAEPRTVFNDNGVILPYVLSMTGEAAFNRCKLVR